jgi:carbohydrate kinase (thermoresistant glucokinase family)
MIVVLMGVCGSGKTTVGKALAERLHWRFLDADDFHPLANVEKMARGMALTDDDRWPWFDRIVAELKRQHAASAHVVVACSALKQVYRERLAQAGDVRFAYLKGGAATIAPRLAGRSGHFMPASLLTSQFATLEEPSTAIVIDVAEPVEAQVAAITRALQQPLPA